MASNQVIILAIDGGGIRGIIPAYILSQIELYTQKRCYELFDIVGGTSTGGILTAGLTTLQPGSSFPFSSASLLKIYQQNGANIFVAQNTDFAATYYGDDGNGNGVEPYLRQMIGPALLSQARGAVGGLPTARVRQVFTTGYTVSSTGNTVTNPVKGKDYGAYLFNWHDAAWNPADNYFVWEAARATSAAPTYFPVACVGGNKGGRSNAAQRWVLDGGTMSNNPAMWAITEAFRLKLAQSLSDITLISLGTGVYPGACGAGIHTNYSIVDCPDNGNWSETPWVMEDMYDLQGNQNRGLLINVVLDAVQQVSGNQLTAMQAGGLNYYRMEPLLPFALSAMDNVSPSNIASLTNFARDYVEGAGASTFKQIINILSKITAPELTTS